MKDRAESARDDLAFVRALMSESGQVQDSLGQALLAGGACYGIQCLLQAILATGIQVPVLVHLTVGILPTVIFIILITRISIRDRNRSQHSVGTRAINAAFGGGGLAALTTALIFGWLAFRTQNMGTWLLHPIMICVVQGTVWYIAFAIRRRGWYGLISAGWFATSLGLAIMLGLGDDGLIVPFLLVLAAALLGLMALPGWVLMRAGQHQA
ncbi:hypothetical protein P1X14_00470 [Sphingomonas sp. AOB5]|uniref:hypothetical protein n=1 Tax=Sphingomonas sp. AOB5 TaxID=3034017 RepID=UPI0023F670F5|nr:hypothetical protein [Sphingomonas sp. AOB5]MDF7773705.1 hypothetical protein [Sphingomonas sp. AOB5]